MFFRYFHPITTNLLVADETRSNQTIYLVVSPSLKALGVPGRPRLFESKQKIKEAEIRLKKKISYITAPPQMATYIRYSADIYSVYLKYIAPEDIHVYSIDEVFMDVTDYMSLYRMTPHELAMTMIRDVLHTTGIIATAGIGTNMYLAKIAMDIVAKHMQPDADGVRVAELTEDSYKAILWTHTPLTDFWQIGPGTSRKLQEHGMNTLGDVAVMSLTNEDYLYTLFGIDAELLIDHAWGMEPCTMQKIKSYTPTGHSLNNGQVLPRPYTYEEARLVVKEMTDLLVLDLVDKGLVTNSISMYIGYDRLDKTSTYTGPIHLDHYGRMVPSHSKGTAALGTYTNSTMLIMNAVIPLFDRIAKRNANIRRIFLTACNTAGESSMMYQFDLFTDWKQLEREKKLQNRAKLFAPFDALNGFGEAILKRNKITEPPGELSEDAKEALDRKFQFLLSQYQKQDKDTPLIVTVIYFQRDWKAENITKNGIRGNYLQLTGMVSRIDLDARMLQIVEQKIPLNDIYSLNGDIFHSLNDVVI